MSKERTDENRSHRAIPRNYSAAKILLPGLDPRLSPDGEPPHPVAPTTDDGVKGLAVGVAFEREHQGLGGPIGPYLIGVDPLDLATVVQRRRSQVPIAGRELNGGRFAFPVSEAEQDQRLQPGTQVLVVTIGGEARAYRVAQLGAQLLAVPSRTAFWFAIIAAEPETMVYSADGRPLADD